MSPSVGRSFEHSPQTSSKPWGGWVGVGDGNAVAYPPSTRRGVYHEITVEALA